MLPSIEFTLRNTRIARNARFGAHRDRSVGAGGISDATEAPVATVTMFEPGAIIRFVRLLTRVRLTIWSFAPATLLTSASLAFDPPGGSRRAEAAAAPSLGDALLGSA